MSETAANMEQQLQEQITQAKASCVQMAMLTAAKKNKALELIERELLESMNDIIEANALDLEAARAADIPAALIDRLTLNSERIMGMAQGIRKVIGLKDPVGTVLDGWRHPNEMQITKVRVPLGVIGIIYEGRPNVTTDAVALAIKSGNAVVLRGSQHAWNSNLAVMEVVKRALRQTDVPETSVQYLMDKSRDSAKVMLRAEKEISLVIPRGGEALKKFVLSNSLVPVLGAGGGLCHVYIDSEANTQSAIDIALNAKTQRPGVCNACETILVHKETAEMVLPRLVETLQAARVEVLGDEEVEALSSSVTPATEEDWSTEYLDLKVSIKVVDSLQEAIEHINKYSTGHSDCIVTDNAKNADLFKRMVDSSSVYVNVSTRFTDGEEFGFGAEMGISTQRMHARGPIGMNELCTYKYIIEGNGQTR